MNKLIAIVFSLIAAVALSDTEAVYLKGRVKTNGNLLILGADNIEREAVLLTVAEYAALTNAMTYLSGIREYREKIHGPVVRRVADAETKKMSWHYLDGFIWVEPMMRVDGAPSAKIVSRETSAAKAANGTAMSKPTAMSEEQWQALQRKREASKGVTVNATFAPGGRIREVK